ncbi:hypothetical protein QCA50_003461 [Cerrena zonata]|uniref:Uncharacterized protein n=1 Tax=Cerrena zonata TaxID=2478898 RepID=A0AAW0GTZ7_9APHY
MPSQALSLSIHRFPFANRLIPSIRADVSPIPVCQSPNLSRCSRNPISRPLQPNRSPNPNHPRHALPCCSVTGLLEKLAPTACLQCHPLSLRSHDPDTQSKFRPTADPNFLNSIAALPILLLECARPLFHPPTYRIHPSFGIHTYPFGPSPFSTHTNMAMPSHTGHLFLPSNNTSNRQFQSDTIVLTTSMNLSICQ